MSAENLPKWLTDNHPELVDIFQALQEFERGEEVTATCPTCGQKLKVTHIEVINTIWVKCPSGCTTYREVRRGTKE